MPRAPATVSRLPQESDKRRQAPARTQTPRPVSMLVKQNAYQRDRVALMPWASSIRCTRRCEKETMNINLEQSGYKEKHRETVSSRYGTAEIFEIYAPSGRFVGFQIYRANRQQNEPFITLLAALPTPK